MESERVVCQQVARSEDQYVFGMEAKWLPTLAIASARPDR